MTRLELHTARQRKQIVQVRSGGLDGAKCTVKEVREAYVVVELWEKHGAYDEGWLLPVQFSEVSKCSA